MSQLTVKKESVHINIFHPDNTKDQSTLTQGLTQFRA